MQILIGSSEFQAESLGIIFVNPSERPQYLFCCQRHFYSAERSKPKGKTLKRNLSGWSPKFQKTLPSVYLPKADWNYFVHLSLILQTQIGS